MSPHSFDADRPPTAAAGRPLVLALFARFTDELLYGAVSVLIPQFRAALGLTYAQVGLLETVLAYTASAVDPVASLLIDVWSRRWLLALGALGVAASVLIFGFATSLPGLLVAFALYGAGGGPLAYTADATLVQGREGTQRSRMFARATALETLGALLGPAFVTAWLWGDLDWRGLLRLLGAASCAYALALAATEFPAATAHGRRTRGSRAFVRHIGENVRVVLGDREALYWLLFLRLHYTIEAPFAYRAVWLTENGSMSQSVVGLYVAATTGSALLGVLAYERWLHRVPARRVLLVTYMALAALFPLWFAASSVSARFALGAPLAFTFALPWTIARPASLSTGASPPGAVTAVNSFTGLLPITLGVGVLAEAIGLTAASLGTHLAGALALLFLTWRMPASVRARHPGRSS